MITLFFICVTSYFVYCLYILFGLFRHIIKKKTPKKTNLVSVVIAARNEEKTLPKLLKDLVNQDYPKNKLEIIIANDRSSDKTGDIIEKTISKHKNIKHVKIKNTNETAPKKFALEQAINQSNGKIIISTDADCRVLKTWVSSMVSSLNNKDGIIIGFSQVLAKSFFERYQSIDFFCIFIANVGFAGWEKFFSGSGQNLAYTKKSFYDIGGFSSKEKSISADDMYLVQSISSIEKCQINFDPNSYVSTYPEKTIISFLNQRIRWSSYAKNNLGRNNGFFLFLLSSFSCNVATLFFIFMNPIISLIIILVKSFLEGLIIFKGTKLFRIKISAGSFVFWSILQPLYIPFVALAGLTKLYNWK